jgi:hypothetical protein
LYNAGGAVASSIARWNGTLWWPLGPGIDGHVHALLTLPDGDVIAGGIFPVTGGWHPGHVARWNGATWSMFGTGTDDRVYALAQMATGDVFAGGDFLVVDGEVRAYFARLTTTCPASATVSGAGCAGSGGPNALAATSLPWIGGTFTSTAAGMPANGVAIDVLGVDTASIQLAAILPQGAPGCSLLVDPFVLTLLVPASGTAATAIPIPDAPALVGGSLHQQVVALEIGAAGAIASVTGTNRLTLTIGAF